MPADARLLELRSTTFSTDEGSLTGESATVSKATEAVPREARIQDKQCMVRARNPNPNPNPDPEPKPGLNPEPEPEPEPKPKPRPHQVFAGTVVSNGRATAVVTATGSASEIGRIQQAPQLGS